MVDRERFGEKRICPACGCKFYDMHRDPPTCPKCGVDVSQVYEPEEEGEDLSDEHFEDLDTEDEEEEDEADDLDTEPAGPVDDSTEEEEVTEED